MVRIDGFDKSRMGGFHIRPMQALYFAKISVGDGFPVPRRKAFMK